MSSTKEFMIDCELTLRYSIPVKAADEDMAREKAQDLLKLIAETQDYKSPITSHEIFVDSAQELVR